jgi:hypothetical protein
MQAYAWPIILKDWEAALSRLSNERQQVVHKQLAPSSEYSNNST